MGDETLVVVDIEPDKSKIADVPWVATRMQNRVAETTREPTTGDVDWGDGNSLLIRLGVLGKVV